MPKIILNGIGVLVPNELIDYQTVCLLANTPEKYTPTVTYSFREPGREQRTGAELCSTDKPIKLVDGMVINCMVTGLA